MYFYQYRILTRAFTSVEKFYHWSNWEDCIYCRIFDCSWHPELIALCSYWIAIYIVFFFLFFTAVLLISENIYFTSYSIKVKKKNKSFLLSSLQKDCETRSNLHKHLLQHAGKITKNTNFKVDAISN